MCGDLEACPSWENNTIVRRGERRVGESCNVRAEAPTSWATKFVEVENWLSVNFGFPKI